jgi:hypothetical protein
MRLLPERLSRLPPKLVPLLVRAAFGGRRHRPSSHRRSTSRFPFVLSLSYTPGFNPPITCSLFNPLFPHVCLWVIVLCNTVRLLWARLCCIVFVICWVNTFIYSYLLSCVWFLYTSHPQTTLQRYDGCVAPWCLDLRTIVYTDECCTFRHLEIARKDEPDLWRSTIF